MTKKKKKRQIRVLGLFLTLQLPNTANAELWELPPLKRQTSCVEEIGRTEKSMLKLKAKSANSNADLCKYRMFFFPFFSTMKHFFYSLLFWSKTDVFNYQSPNCYSFVTYLCNSCKYTLLLKLLYLKIIKLLDIWKIVWQSFMNPLKH